MNLCHLSRSVCIAATALNMQALLPAAILDSTGFDTANFPTTQVTSWSLGNWSGEGPAKFNRFGASSARSKWHSMRVIGTSGAGTITFAPLLSASSLKIFLTHDVRWEAVANVAALATYPLLQQETQIAFVSSADNQTATLYYLGQGETGPEWKPTGISRAITYKSSPQPANVQRALAGFVQVDLLFDYAAGTFSLWVDGVLVALNEDFATPGLTGFSRYRWSTVTKATSYLDAVTLADELLGKAAIGDVDGDHLANGYELANATRLGLRWDQPDDVTIDHDGDGLSLYQESILGLDPLVADALNITGQGLLEEYWGESSLLKAYTRFAYLGNLHPTRRQQVGGFDYERGLGAGSDQDDYGRRLRGWLTVPETGEYTFWGIFSQDGEVWLGESSATAERIVSSRSWNLKNDWEQTVGQKSLPITLQAGQAYYVDMRLRGNQVNEFQGLRYQKAGWSAPLPIPTEQLAPFVYDWAVDDDLDGLPTAWEIAHGFNPWSSTGHDGLAGDRDGDGIANELEWRFGFDPSVAESMQPPLRSEMFEFGNQPALEIPSPWINLAVGNARAGDAFKLGEDFALIAEGQNFGHGSNYQDLQGWVKDGYQFVYQTINKPFELVARVQFDYLPDTTPYAGLMATAQLGNAQPRASLYIGGDYRPAFSFRPKLNAGVQSLEPRRAGIVGPHWLRLHYDNGSFYGARSLNGVDWVSYGQVDLDLGSDLMVGLFASATREFNYVGARFDQVNLRIDSDSDGLYDDEEALLGTNPHSSDTDGDGYTDADELLVTKTDPLVADLSATHTLISQQTGSSAVVQAGLWSASQGGLVSLDYRGELDYQLTVPAAGYYRLDVYVQEASAYRSLSRFEIALAVNGQPVGSQSVSTGAQEAHLSYWLPWLEAGVAQVNLDWVNVEAGSTLKLVRVELVSPDFITESARTDWIARRKTEEFGPAPASSETLLSSPVSPYQLEGRAIDLAPLQITAAGVSLNPRRALSDTWYADIPLQVGAAATTHVETHSASGWPVLTHRVSWQVTDLAASSTPEALALRKGGQLLLGLSLAEALPTGAWIELYRLPVADTPPPALSVDAETYLLLASEGTSGGLAARLASAQVQPYGNQLWQAVTYANGVPRSFAPLGEQLRNPALPVPTSLDIPLRIDAAGLAAGEVLQMGLNEAGLYLIRAHGLDAAGEIVERTLKITVVDPELGAPVSVTSGYIRTWTPPSLPAGLIVLADPEVSVQEKTGSSPRRFDVQITGTQGRRVLCRLGTEGPVLDTVMINPVINYTPQFNPAMRVLTTFTDGTMLLEFTLAFGGDLPDDFQVQVTAIKAGVTFADGTLSKIVTKADLDALGRYVYRMALHAGVPGAGCHTYQIQQSDTAIHTTL
jgi:hypothetical protein